MNSFLITYIQPIQNIIAAIIAAGIAHLFNKNKIFLDKESFKRDLFLKYNDRYDKLNNNLEETCLREAELQKNCQLLHKQSLEEMIKMFFANEPQKNPDFIKSIYDYINLCAEEHYWYKKGLIDEEVWKCWHLGMIYWYKNSSLVQKIVDDEKEKGSPYYHSDFFKLFQK